jgi:DNA-binding transcriptional ArsR family regulator
VLGRELATAVDMQQSAVSHQLRLLRHLGSVIGERAGRNVVTPCAMLLDEAVYHAEHLRLGVTDPHSRAVVKHSGP